MKKVLFAFLALTIVTVFTAQAAGHWVKPTVTVSGVKGSAEVDVSVDYSGNETGGRGHESRMIRGNGTVKFYDIASDMTRVVFTARVQGCGRCVASKRFNHVPSSVTLEIP